MIDVNRQLNKRKIGLGKRKKLRILLESQYHESKPTTCIEHLPNELFFEIFDYLDGYEIYHSFSKLNLRFQHVLCSSALRLKINLSPFLHIDIQDDCLEIISQQKNQIISLRLIYTLNTDRFFALISFDSSFSRLESLIFDGLKSDELLQHLSVLSLLPRLISFNLCIEYNLNDFSDVYRLIFNLPVLKYMKLSSEVYEPFIPLSIATHDQFSSIEYLIINHSCSLNDLISILSYTPQLNRLTCRELLRSTESITEETKMYLFSLTFICIAKCYVVFDILEFFLKQLSSPLEVLRIHTYWDTNYLDATRWERSIVEYMPSLREFSLQHHEFIDDDFQITEFHSLTNRFLSSFWITREYIFELAIDVDDCSWSEMIYSIHPYRRKWNEQTDSSITEYPEDIELTLTIPLFREYHELFTDNTITLFPLLPIGRLNIPSHDFFVGTLIDLLHHLPNLHSLNVWSLSLPKTPYLSDEQVPYTIRCSLSKTNKITRVIIQSLTELSQLQFLIDLCPNVQYLQIGCLNDINPKPFIQFILTQKIKHISQLGILCLHLSIANDRIIQEFQDMIDSEERYHNCTIKCLYNKVYFQWKK